MSLPCGHAESDRLEHDGCATCHLHDAIEWRDGEIARLEARAAELEVSLRALLKGTNDWHLEDCRAYGAPDDDVQDDPLSPDPYCDCGMTADRRNARAALERTTDSVSEDQACEAMLATPGGGHHRCGEAKPCRWHDADSNDAPRTKGDALCPFGCGNKIHNYVCEGDPRLNDALDGEWVRLMPEYPCAFASDGWDWGDAAEVVRRWEAKLVSEPGTVSMIELRKPGAKNLKIGACYARPFAPDTRADNPQVKILLDENERLHKVETPLLAQVNEQEVANPTVDGPPIEVNKGDPSGESIGWCSNCGLEQDEPHSWRECAIYLRDAYRQAADAADDFKRLLDERDEKGTDCALLEEVGRYVAQLYDARQDEGFRRGVKYVSEMLDTWIGQRAINPIGD